MTARMFDSYPMAVVTSADGFTTSVEVDRGEIVNASRLDGLLRPLKVWIWNKRDDGCKGCEPVLQVVYKLP